jgi:hypothetical protein
MKDKKVKKERAGVPAEHWERSYDLSKPSRNMELTAGSDFVAKPPQERKTTHLKVNEQDH